MAAPSDASDFLKLVTKAVASAKAAEEGSGGEASRAVDVLRTLARRPVTVDLLVATQAGKTIRKLSKHSDAGVASAASEAVKGWKKMLKGESNAEGGEGAKRGRNGVTGAGKADGKMLDEEKGKAVGAGKVAGSAIRPSSAEKGGKGTGSGPKSIPETGDVVRDRVRKNLADGLKRDAQELGADAVELAVDVEVAAFKQNGGVNADYKAKVRSLMFNIGDPQNSGLRRRILSRQVSGEVLVTLKSEELASEEKQKMMAEIRQKKQLECQRGGTMQASTNAFQCKVCRQRKCTYYQMQTRSADEPMTTFVTCTNCNNRWKFC
eukprot:evm.model.scf_1302.2 EVM.evm.TU.scf_1302.2   scf_1302:3826-4788(+)